MKVTYKYHCGDDLSVVNAARVSFNKESDWICACGESDAWVHDYDYEYYCGACKTGDDLTLSINDKKLIKYLAKHNHWTPFAHNSITLHIKAPIFVARQLGKHQVGFVWNEVSRRYVDDEPEFHMSDVWRERADNVKQGSGEGEVTLLRLQGFTMQTIPDAVSKHQAYSRDLYRDMLDAGVCPEQARMVLPQSMYTEWYMTGNLYAWHNLYRLRIDSHTQKETQVAAKQVGEIIEPLFPISWEALNENS